LSYFFCFLLLHYLLIDCFYHTLWISNSSSPFLGPRHWPFWFSTPIPPWYFLSCPIRQTENFFFGILFHLPYHCILVSIHAALYSFYSSAFCFSVSSVSCLLISFTSYVTQLFFVQEPLPSVLLGLCSLVVIFPTFYKSHYFPLRYLLFYVHHYSSWR